MSESKSDAAPEPVESARDAPPSEPTNDGDPAGPTAEPFTREEIDAAVVQQWGRLHRLALKWLGDHERAIDAVQAAITEALERPWRFARGPAGNVLNGFLLNALRTELRRAKRHQSVDFDAVRDELQPISTEPAVDRELLRTEAMALVRREVARLSPRLARTIEACDLDGLTLAEAARDQRVALSTAWAARHRGRAHLERELESTYGDPSEFQGAHRTLIVRRDPPPREARDGPARTG